VTDRFLKLSNEIARRKDLTSTAKIVHAVLSSRIGPGGYSWPGLRSIAEDAGISKPTVVTAIADLKAAGLIEVESRGTGRCNRYRLAEESNQEPVKEFDRSKNLTSQEVLPSGKEI
jgi:Bacterial regulatory proteins, gntR family.